MGLSSAPLSYHSEGVKPVLAFRAFVYRLGVDRWNLLTSRFSFTFNFVNLLFEMSAANGTFRGTPGRGQGRGQVPVFENPNPNSPSNIPRPKLESHASSAMQSETGTSTLSASRQKQSKRDEVPEYASTTPLANADAQHRLSGRKWKRT